MNPEKAKGSVRTELYKAVSSTLKLTDAEVDAALLNDEHLRPEEVDERMRRIELRGRATTRLRSVSSPIQKQKTSTTVGAAVEVR